MFDFEAYCDHMIDLYGAMVEELKAEFNRKFVKQFGAELCERYFSAFAECLLGQFGSGIAQMRSVAQKYWLTGMEGKTVDELKQMETEKLECLQMKNDNEALETFAQNTERLRRVIETRMQLLLQKAALQAQNAFMEEAKKDVEAQKELVRRYMSENVIVNSQAVQLRDNQGVLADLNKQLEAAIAPAQ